MLTLKHAKRVLRYVKRTVNLGLEFKRRETKIKVEAYVDAEFGRHENGKSVYGYVLNINDAPIVFKTKKLNIVTLSTTESEFLGISEVSKKIMWIKNILEFLEVEHEKIKILNDNLGAIRIAKNKSSIMRTKHINIRYFYIQELLENDECDLEYVRSDENLADGFTKSLGNVKFGIMVSRLLNERV